MLVLAIDGGGTKTEAVVADGEGRCLGAAFSGGSNPNYVGWAAAEHAIASAVGHVLSAVGAVVAAESIAQAACCIPGMRNHRAPLTRLLEEELGLSRVLYESDTESTFAGALGAEQGVAVLAGTGSFAMGVNDKRERLAVGGWGPIVGDPGSGYAMAASALRAAALAHDGRGPATQLTDKLMRHYAIADIALLKSVVTADNASGLTHLVREAAEEGDAVSLRLIREAGEQLAELAITVIRRLQMESDRYSVALTGGMTAFGVPLRSAFAEALGRSCPSINRMEPFGSPAAGALLLAYREAGIPWSSGLLRNLKETLGPERRRSDVKQNLL